jgi:hypothetical protein
MDSYQPIYDAVRSRISGGNVGEAVERAAREAFDMGMTRQILQEEFLSAAHEMQRPSVLYRPTISADGTAWCALLGDNLQEGVAGFGDTPDAAMRDFDIVFWKSPTPTAARLAQPRSSEAATPVSDEGPGTNTSILQDPTL